jgi:hypothetical protein
MQTTARCCLCCKLWQSQPPTVQSSHHTGICHPQALHTSTSCYKPSAHTKQRYESAGSRVLLSQTMGLACACAEHSTPHCLSALQVARVVRCLKPQGKTSPCHSTPPARMQKNIVIIRPSKDETCCVGRQWRAQPTHVGHLASRHTCTLTSRDPLRLTDFSLCICPSCSLSSMAACMSSLSSCSCLAACSEACNHVDRVNHMSLRSPAPTGKAQQQQQYSFAATTHPKVLKGICSRVRHPQPPGCPADLHSQCVAPGSPASLRR